MSELEQFQLSELDQFLGESDVDDEEVINISTESEEGVTPQEKVATLRQRILTEYPEITDSDDKTNIACGIEFVCNVAHLVDFQMPLEGEVFKWGNTCILT